MTEIELIDRIKTNPENFSELFKLFYKSIFGYILRRTGNFDDTADIAADTFLKAFTHINHFDYRGISIKVWLYRIATNEVNLYFRQQHKHNSVFDKIDFENRALFKNYLLQDKEELEIELQKHEQFLAVLKALQMLPIKYQNVISLRYFEGRTIKKLRRF
ncbi:MAG TPA: RNA polymerase sigma factor [Williamwhitmania sp.]|nr:RNA polymerase sigma factor [Williamwhitmania sp.]